MDEREVWIQAFAIIAAHGGLSPEYISDQVSDVLGSGVVINDWRAVAAAVDMITAAGMYSSN